MKPAWAYTVGRVAGYYPLFILVQLLFGEAAAGTLPGTGLLAPYFLAVFLRRSQGVQHFEAISTTPWPCPTNTSCVARPLLMPTLWGTCPPTPAGAMFAFADNFYNGPVVTLAHGLMSTGLVQVRGQLPSSAQSCTRCECCTASCTARAQTPAGSPLPLTPAFAHARQNATLLPCACLQAWFPAHAEIWNAPTWFLSALTFAMLVLPYVLPSIAEMRKKGLRKLLLALTGVSLLGKLAYSYDLKVGLGGGGGGALLSSEPGLLPLGVSAGCVLVLCTTTKAASRPASTHAAPTSGQCPVCGAEERC